MTHPDPIFIFGALRSGTTLFRLMLNAHPNLHNPGEVDFLFDFIAPDPSHPTGWRYDRNAMSEHRIFKARGLTLPPDCDGLDLLHALLGQLAAKAPGVPSLNVHRHADRILACLPQARFVHLVRDPRDVARSSIGMGWSGTSWRGVDHWIATETGWDAANIPEDQVLTLRFEDLMTHLEPHLREVCAFHGVAFSPQMLTYHLNTSYGPPDPSISQQWQRKASAREIARLEGRCGDLITARGYTLAGRGYVPRAPERLWLDQKDRVLRAYDQARRFGVLLWAGAYLARLPGFRGLKPYIRRQKEARAIELLK